jgi:hypothetical protein
MSGGWQKTALEQTLGGVIDVGLDPLTYTTLGTTELGTKLAAKELGKQFFQSGEKTAFIKGAKRLSGPSVARAARKPAVGEVKTEAAKIADELSRTKRAQAAIDKEFRAEVGKLRAKGGTPNLATLQQLHNEAAARYAAPISARAEKFLLTSTRRRAAIKIAGRDILGYGSKGGKIGRGLYKPLELAGAGLSKVPGAKAVRQAFSVADHFPGISNRLRRIAEGRGVVNNEKMMREIDSAVSGLSRQDRILVRESLEDPLKPSLAGQLAADGKKDLGDVQDYFRDLGDKMFKDKESVGIYKAMDHSDDYVPLYLRGGTPEEIAAFKAARKAQLRSGLPFDPEKFGTQAAKETGLKPYEMVDDAYKMAYADTTRKLVKNHTITDFMNKFGFVTENPELAKGMTDVTSKIPKGMQQQIFQGSAKKVYMHPQMAKALHSLDEISKLSNSEELSKFMRFFGRVTNMWKRSATVYNPGNWVNNTMGDMYFNFIDGVVNPKYYINALKALGDNPGGFVKLGGRKVSLMDVKKLYEDYAAGGGFLRADVSQRLHSITGLEHHPLEAVTKGYAKREDFGRLAHFMHALEDEMTRVPRSAAPTIRKRMEIAAEAAGERLAKWNIDYSAFTPFERKLKGTGMPFYSWTRKSIPLMMEAMITKPGRVGAIEKLQRSITGAHPEQGDAHVDYPLWMRDAGYTRLSGGPNPTVIPNVLPSNVLGKNFGKGDLSPKDMLLNIASMLHPAGRIPLEVATGKQFFSGGSEPTSPLDIALANYPGAASVSAALGHDVRDTFSNASEQKTLNTGQRIGTFLGNKPYNVTDQMQISELRRQQDALDYAMKQINKKAGDWRVRKTSKGYQVYNEVTHQNFPVQYANAGDAQKMAVQMGQQGK